MLRGGPIALYQGFGVSVQARIFPLCLVQEPISSSQSGPMNWRRGMCQLLTAMIGLTGGEMHCKSIGSHQ